ncbi:MAG: hypothetical protein ABGX07_14975, partial [Pirellulaceae bacterium]
MEQTYSLKQVRNFFTLYFIPVIPLNIAGRFIECHSCGTCYEEEVLSYDPEIERAETAAQMLRIMVLAALADERRAALSDELRSARGMAQRRGAAVALPAASRASEIV